ncbi:MAG: serine/threonine-protein kinase PknK [Polyangiales bacterium]
MAEQAPVVYGKYQLLELLARGGMAEVFKAKSHGVEGFEKILVIKRILPELAANPRFVEMFINEAKIAVSLSHANIVQVFDLGRADDTYFIAMEFVAGYDLATLMQRSRQHGRPLPYELAVYVVSEIAKGLDYAHRRRDSQMRPLNIVHRDVSPQNVLMSFEGEVKLTDFGIAKARTTVEEDADTGVLKGKYAYMAPEQARDEQVDARSDLFALGTVLYEALSGSNPFLASSTYETVKRVQNVDAPPLAQVAPDVPEELADIVTRTMHPDPGERHPNAGRLYEDLIQFLYASGRRVGAHDLGAYLDDVHDAAERRPEPADDARLRAAFEMDARSARRREGAENTPVEIPAARLSTPGRTGTGMRKRRTSLAGVRRGERRDVTALGLAVARDEPLGEAEVRTLLRRHGGVLVEQKDDEEEGRHFVALFGAKDPDGYDTESAARAALSLARAGAQAAEDTTSSTLQIGVHCGRVLFDLAGELIRDERYSKLVDAVREVMQNAPDGGVLVSPSAERPLRGSFQLAADTDDAERGFVLSAELEATARLGKFVGRRDELRRIGEVLALANKGRRRVLGVVGEAGSGKSRLLTETMRRLRLGGHDVGMYVARVSRQTHDVPLSGIQELLRAILGVEELDPEAAIREKVGRLRELGLPRAELGAVELALGLPSEGSERPTGDRPLRAALARIATKLAEDRLTIIAVDGVEALDHHSQQMLHWLIEDAYAARVLLVLTYRPGFANPWTELPDYYQIQLGPFSDAELARLMAARLGCEEVPGELLREVAAKSAGNPLYVEEHLKALRDANAVSVKDAKVVYDRDVAAVEVPKTLRGIVGSRLARLEEGERDLLQIASVAGARFGGRLLSYISEVPVEEVEHALERLAERGIVVPQGQNEYQLAHELFGNVLREGLTVEARREMHGAVAMALEELFPEHADELAERLAYHHREAGNRDKAIDYLVRATDRLESEQALGGAIQNLAKAIEMLSQVPSPNRDRVLSLYRRMGDLCFRSRDLESGADRMQVALDLADGLGREDYVARFAMMRGRLLVHANRIAEGRQWLDRARQVARGVGNVELLRDVTLATAESHTRNGEWGRASGLLDEALQLSRETGDIQAQIRCLIPLAQSHAGRGDKEAALQALEEAGALQEVHPDRFNEVDLIKNDCLVHHLLGDKKRAAESATKALELSKEYGFPYEISVNAHNLGESYLALGDYKRAFANLRYSYEVARDHGFVKLQYHNMRVLGFIDAARFGSKEGRDRVEEAVRYAADQGYIWDLIQAKYMLALVDHMQGNTEEARQGFREVLRMSAEYGNKHYEADADTALKAIDAGEEVPLPG